MIIPPIEKIDQLNRNLNLGPGLGGYLDLLKAIKLPESEWSPYELWKENRYTRNCISSCKEFELLLLCWDKNQHSPIHSYNFQEGWIKVLKGELTVEIYHVNKEDNSCTLDEEITIREKEYTYLNDNMGFHRVRNSSDGKTVSLHLHSERVDTWQVLHKCKSEIETVKPQYDSSTADCSK